MWAGSSSMARSTSRRAASRRLLRQAVHEVEVEVADAGCAQLRDCLADLAARVDPAQRREAAVVETLRAERDPVDPGVPVRGECPVLDRAGICLERDLRVARNRQQIAEPRKHRLDGAGGEQARRSAAEEDRHDLAPGDRACRELKVVEQCREIHAFGHACRRDGMRVEVAVRALAHAPRQVHVEGERRLDQRGHDPRSPPPSAATSRRSAWPRWLTRFFSSDSNSAAVRSVPATKKSGS